MKKLLISLFVPVLVLGFVSQVGAAPSYPTVNSQPMADDDNFSVNEDGSVTIDIGMNDSDPDGPLTVVEIDGQDVSVGETVTVVNGVVTVNADGTLTFVPDAEYSGSISFTYTVADLVASSDAGLSFHLESTNDNGPLIFVIDLATGEKSYLMNPTFGSATAMAFEPATGFIYIVRANGDVWIRDGNNPAAGSSLIGNVESTAMGWTDPIPTSYSHQTAAFYNGALYLVPTGAPDDALYRVDLNAFGSVGDVTKVADMSGNTVEWNNNDDMTIDPATGIVYGRSDTNDTVNSMRDSYFYSYEIATGTWTLITSDSYAFDYVDRTNNAPATNFRLASIGLTVGEDGNIYGTGGGGDLGRLDPSTGAWTPLATFVPDDSDLAVGGDLAGRFRYLNGVTATVDGTVDPVNDPPVANDDATTTEPGQAVTIDPLAGVGADSDVDGALDPSTVSLIAPVGAAVDGGVVTVAGVGSWQVDAATGAVTFTPEAGFAGLASIGYTVSDSDGLVSNQATITVEVPAAPVEPEPEPEPEAEILAVTGSETYFAYAGLVLVLLGALVLLPVKLSRRFN